MDSVDIEGVGVRRDSVLCVPEPELVTEIDWGETVETVTDEERSADAVGVREDEEGDRGWSGDMSEMLVGAGDGSDGRDDSDGRDCKDCKDCGDGSDTVLSTVTDTDTCEATEMLSVEIEGRYEISEGVVSDCECDTVVGPRSDDAYDISGASGMAMDMMEGDARSADESYV
jgi:hypothetical protein